jgi:hypothetical protein
MSLKGGKKAKPAQSQDLTENGSCGRHKERRPNSSKYKENKRSGLFTINLTTQSTVPDCVFTLPIN